MYKQAGFYVRKTLVEDIVFNVFFTDLSKPWIIFLPGLPQYIHKHWYLKDLIQDYCVLNPYYPGSFHSFGEFTPTSFTKTVDTSITLLETKEFFDHFEQKAFEHTGVISGIWGLSFGANLIVEYLSRTSNVDIPVVIVSPMLKMSMPVLNDYWKQKTRFLASPVYQNIFRGLNDAAFRDWLNSTEALEIPPKTRGVLLYGKNDRYMDADFLSAKFSALDIHILEEYAHEVDNIIGFYVKSNYAINN
ncbi:MAG: hypothetical protein ACOZAO_03880 [Patescibacteria group bacterium]